MFTASDAFRACAVNGDSETKIFFFAEPNTINPDNNCGRFSISNWRNTDVSGIPTQRNYNAFSGNFQLISNSTLPLYAIN